MPQQSDKVPAHLVDIEWPDRPVKNPCNEISLPVLMQPHHITLLRIKGAVIFDYTESLLMDPELVSPQSCYAVFSGD